MQGHPVSGVTFAYKLSGRERLSKSQQLSTYCEAEPCTIESPSYGAG